MRSDRSGSVTSGAGPGSAQGVRRGDTCELWWATARLHPARTGLLSPAELAQARRRRGPGDRARFVTGRALARVVLGARTGLHPTEVRLDTTCPRCGGDHGKPTLASPTGPGPVGFNLAHAGDRVVLAVTDGAAVGVDVEVVGELGAHQLAALGEEVLTEAEHAAYLGLPARDRARAMAVWWARKEAVLKATGDGLAIPPCQVGVTGPGVAPAVTVWPAGVTWPDGGSPSARLRDLAAGPTAVACVAVLGTGPLVVDEHDGDPLLDRLEALR